MIASRLLAVTILGCSLLAGSAAAQPIAASRGAWAGTIGERSSAWPAGDGRIALRIEGSDTRFSVNLAGAGEQMLAGEFQAGKRKDVYEPPAAGGMMSFFGRDAAANPLEGKPLAWARRAGEELVVYRLEIRDGAYRLDRMMVRPAGNRLELAFERREHDRPPVRFGASLERQRP